MAAAIPLLLPMASGDPGPDRCAVVDGHGRCLVVAADPGRPGGPQERSRAAAPARKRPDKARATPATPPPPSLDAVITGGGWAVGERPDPAELLKAVAEPGGVRRQPATAAVLAQRAVAELTLQPPALRTSVQGSGFVGVPVWLWIGDGGELTEPVSATAAAGAAKVTAVGRLAAVEWSLGPPGATVRCNGPGTPWTGQDGPSPDCGYVYTQRSLPERTGGTGSWTITATSIWAVTWAGVSDGAPVDGQQTVQVSAETALTIGEVQVLVSGGGR